MSERRDRGSSAAATNTTGDSRAGEDVADCIVAEAIKAQREKRYGVLTNPFMLGLLTAAEIVRRELGAD